MGSAFVSNNFVSTPTVICVERDTNESIKGTNSNRRSFLYAHIWMLTSYGVSDMGNSKSLLALLRGTTTIFGICKSEHSGNNN